MDNPNRLVINLVTDLHRLANIGPGVTHVEINNIEEPIRLPAFPPQVKWIAFGDVTLDRGVSFAEGVIYLYMEGVTSLDPLSEWDMPASLVELSIDNCHFPTIDLRQSQLKEIHIHNQETHGDQVFLPASLEYLFIFRTPSSKLPWLPRELNTLVLIDGENITDYSGALGAKVKVLETGEPMALYDYFSEVRKLIIPGGWGVAPEISLTHLTTLIFQECDFEGPVEINTPNLERLELLYGARIDLQGSFAENVNTLVLDHYDEFPESDSWFSLTKLIIKTGVVVIDIPRLPWLKWLTVEGQARANGVMVTNLREYKAAWGMTGRKKGANVRELVRIVS